MQVHEMISAHPDVQGSTADLLLRCIEECYNCAQLCTSCADACVAEQSVDKLKQCIRLNLDCADICAAAGAMGSRRTGSNVEVLRAVIRACELACRRCARNASVMAGIMVTAAYAPMLAHGAPTRAARLWRRCTEIPIGSA